MKIYSVLLLVMLVAASQQQKFNTVYEIRQDWKRTVTPSMSRCMCQTGLSNELMHGFFERGEIPNNPCLKCSLFCWAQSLQVVSNSGHVDKKRFSEVFAGIDAPIANKCGSFKHDDLCELGYQMASCVHGILTGEIPYPTSESKLSAFAILDGSYK